MRRPDPDEAGYTLVELLVAAALMTLLTALTCVVLADAKATLDVGSERAGVQQRGRVGLDGLVSTIGSAGAGADRGSLVGPLIRWMPPVWPGRRDRVPTRSAVTTVRAVPSIPPATLAIDAPADAATLDFSRAAACTLPCGFHDRMTVLVLDGLGDFDLYVVTETDGASAQVRHLAGGTGSAYLRGAAVIPVETRTYYWNADRRELRADDGDRSDFPVLDNVVDLVVEYLGDPAPPQQPRPPPGVGNCLYDADGARRAWMDSLPRTAGSLSLLTAAQLDDGPWCGSGGTPFDADLLRVRSIRVTLRIEAADAAFRGLDPLWFRNPGVARASASLVRDLSLSTAVTPRNLGGWR
jgi:hypothetical protein